MEEMVSDTTKEGEEIKGGSYNRTGKSATEGAIDSSKRADTNLESSTREGTPHHRVGEVGSPGQSEESQRGKWEAEKAKLPAGHRMTIYFKALKKLPIIGAAVMGGQLIFSEQYTLPEAVGDLVGAEPVE